MPSTKPARIARRRRRGASGEATSDRALPVPVHEAFLQAGATLPGTVFDVSGRVIFEAGIVLEERHVRALQHVTERGLYCGTDWPKRVIDSMRAIDLNEGGEADTDKLVPDAPRQAVPPQAAPSASETPDPGSTATTSAAVHHDDASDAATDDASAEDGQATVSVSSLRIGMTITTDLYDQSGVLLLAAGRQINDRFLQLLDKRSIRTVCIGETPKEEPEPEKPAPKKPRPKPSKPKPVIQPAPPRIIADTRLLSYSGQIHRGMELHSKTSCVVRAAFASLTAGDTVDGAALHGMVREFSSLLTLDAAALAAVAALKRTDGEYLFDHSVNTALLSMTIGARMRLSRPRIELLGMAAMFQDIGMLLVPEQVRLANRPLTPAEWNEVCRHPLYTRELIEKVIGLPEEAGIIAGQSHERLNGSGYPYRRSEVTMHPLARIVAVADAFTAMTEPRPHREKLVPHLAIREMLIQGRRNDFDREILRHLLDSVSVFALGSRVMLNNGVVCRVTRANPKSHTLPVVVVLDKAGNETETVIDLAEETDLHVIKALTQEQLADGA